MLPLDYHSSLLIVSFFLQGFTSTASAISGSVVPILASPTGGFDSDEVEFLLGVVWDKLKVMKGQMSLEDIALGTHLPPLRLIHHPPYSVRGMIFYQGRTLQSSIAYPLPTPFFTLLYPPFLPCLPLLPPPHPTLVCPPPRNAAPAE